jgi:hypothetical protein
LDTTARTFRLGEKRIMAYIGSGLGEIQAIRAELEQIKATLRELEPTLRASKEQLSNFRILEQVARRYLILARRLGLPADAQRAITILSKVTVAAQTARIAYTALLSATGPIGLAFAGAGILLANLAAADVVSDIVGYD